MEFWKDIPGFENLYQISSNGRVKSFRKSSKLHRVNEHILKPYLSNNGYYQVTLYSGTYKKKLLIHRLVADAFLPNPEHLPQVNHKDENRLNNNVDNLEWCTPAYNNSYGTAIHRAIDTKSKPVIQLTLERVPLAIYRSAKTAAELLSFNAHSIRDCCNNASAGYGYYWEYVNSSSTKASLFS
ncbi:MAG: HNH endonuclease [Clostridia bacterium]|nr:HNH endonuclease [Clostridia bacterium]